MAAFSLAAAAAAAASESLSRRSFRPTDRRPTSLPGLDPVWQRSRRPVGRSELPLLVSLISRALGRAMNFLLRSVSKAAGWPNRALTGLSR